jgi:DNA-binding transcriptional regulator YiaG
MSEQQTTGKRRVGRPRSTPGRVRSLWCTDAGWEWIVSQSTGRGHKSVGKWADALGKAPELTISEKRRRDHGVPTPFERAKDGTNYAGGVRAVRERWGLSTGELGEELGVARRTIEGWEAGRMPGRMAIKQMRELATRVRPLERRETVSDDPLERLADQCEATPEYPQTF